ncbi:MAG TPA: recombinase family protein [Bryobacteraceae bacterium]|nr:recombinase family protein [Bryobacteraceae bacterium]
MRGFVQGRSKAKIGYACVSVYDRNLEFQLSVLERAGCARIFREMSPGPNRLRPELQRMLEEIRPGDIVVVSALDRLARSTRDLLEATQRIHKAGGGFQSLSEPWANTATDAGQTIMTVFAGFAEFERALTRERIGAGQEAAKQRGVRFGRPRKLKPDELQVACQLLADGEPIRDVARTFKVHEATIYRLAAEL